MISSITRLRIFSLSLLLAVTLLPAAATAQTRPSIAALQSQITTQQAQITTLQSQVASSTIPNVGGYVTMDLSTPSRPTLRVAGANLQVVNGLNNTETINGLGNVIVGYDETTSQNSICSLGQYTDQISCVGGGGTWAINHKSGSHNLVIGPHHRYSSYGGLIAGFNNTVNGTSASVTGGDNNTASGPYASVSGGFGNTASNFQAGVGGGVSNTASGNAASVSGGSHNTASGLYSSVSGGNTQTAATSYQWAGGALHSP